jgi:hypothetical protein
MLDSTTSIPYVMHNRKREKNATKREENTHQKEVG